MIKTLNRFVFAFALITGFGSVSAQQISSQAGFGTKVALAGNQVLVGEPMNQRIAGMLYVFNKDPSGTWTETEVLSADDGHPGDRFGVSIDVDGDRMIISATRSDEARGAVYVFERDADGSWAQRARLQPDSVVAGDRFGAGLALDGSTIFASSTPFEAAGSIYVFEQSEHGNWVEMTNIQNDPEADGNMFGAALETSSDALLVGSPSTGNGAVYMYKEDSETGEWTVVQTLIGREADDSADDTDREASGFSSRSRGDFYGTALFVEGPHLLVSAPNSDESTGLVYVYRIDESGMYNATLKLQPFDAQPRHLYGRSMAITGREVWVGSIGADDYTGAIYAMDFHGETLSFSGVNKIAPEGLGRATLFGGSLAANDSVAVVGAQREFNGYGSAYIYEVDEDGEWYVAARIVSELQTSFTSITGGMVKCEDGLAGDYGCENVDLISFVTNKDMGAPHGVMTNDVWGWTDPDSGKEYALVGRNDATSFIDVSDPRNPVVLGQLVRTEGSPASTWRDIKVYKNHAYIVADGAGAHGIQIFDLTQLRDVENPPVDFEETAHYDGIYSAHNIVINEESGFAYTVGNRSGGKTCAGGSHMINIQDPVNPTFAGCFAHVETGRQGTGYTHDAQCVMYSGPDERYTGHEICFGANETAVSISDVTDKDNPIAISTGTYPTPGYTHQGWLSEDQRYLFVNDELDELNGTTDGTRTLIWDIAELDDPILVNEHVSENKASDHNLYIRGNYMYQSNYVSGLRIVDISDVENPVEVGYFDTVSWGEDKPGFGGSWSNYPFFESGIIVVTSGEEGVFFLKRSDVDI